MYMYKSVCDYIYINIHICILYPYLTEFTKINSRWINEPKAKTKQIKTTKVLDDNIGDTSMFVII